jgi:hypothetical protein
MGIISAVQKLMCSTFHVGVAITVAGTANKSAVDSAAAMLMFLDLLSVVF